MFAELFHLKDILMISVIMAAAALGTSAIVILLKGLIKGAASIFKSIYSKCTDERR